MNSLPKQQTDLDKLKAAATTSDERRLSTLKTSLLIATIVSRLRLEFDCATATRMFREDVGPVSERTIRRHLTTMHQLGLVEITRQTPPRKYRWIGMPK